ncbi:uncharacterized protein [Centruroides vittatus]|uniref:uncharacterized protein n=1 Tax=Centruroides vittatus TaxID=120091 RepID=UPI00350FA68B
MCVDWVKQLVELVLNNNFFEFQGKFYRQSEGIPTGFCIGPRLVELCMIIIDKEINETQGIISYQRYVNDCFIVYDKRILDINVFVKEINLMNKNIQFECVKEVDNSLNYLEVTIMYINKIKERTTMLNDQEMEIESIRMFSLNNYHRTLLLKWLETSKIKNVILNRQLGEVKILYLKMEYVFGVFEKLKDLDVILVSSHTRTIEKMINSKYKNNEHDDLEKDNVVYSLDCSCLHKKRYIGETGRKLKTSIKKHILYMPLKII